MGDNFYRPVSAASSPSPQIRHHHPEHSQRQQLASRNGTASPNSSPNAPVSTACLRPYTCSQQSHSPACSQTPTHSRYSSSSSAASSVTLVASTHPSPGIYPTTRFMAGQDQRPENYGQNPSHLAKEFPSRTYQGRPLIDFVTNDWRTDSRYQEDIYASDESESLYRREEDDYWVHPRWKNMISYKRVPRKVQRYLLIYVALLIATWVSWTWFIQPDWEKNKELESQLNVKPTSVFGSNMRPEFSDMTQVKTLDSALLPSEHQLMQRLVVVGDVHGCKEELQKLLEKVSFRSATDHLILTGDIIDKGPDSPGVVDLARELSASSVRGNHEDRMLLTLNDMRAHHASLPGPQEDPGRTVDTLDEESFSHGDYKARALARQFTDKQIRWLQQCPVILRVGEIGGMGEVVVVHAGLVPGVPLERQDPFQVMNMRTIDVDTRLPSDGREGTAWEKLWNHEQAKLLEKERSTVIYGHDSKRGKNILKYSKGLDSGCVNGGKLTAMVIGASKKGKATTKIVSVKCKNQKPKRQ